MYRAVLWVLTVACGGVILWLSLQPATESSALSTGLTSAVLQWFKSYRELAAQQQATVLQTVQNVVRELAHIGEYTVLGTLASLLAHSYRSRVFWRYSLSVTAVFAVVDECIQEWCADGRAMQFIDLLKDWLGCFLGAGMVWILFQLFRKKGKA